MSYIIQYHMIKIKYIYISLIDLNEIIGDINSVIIEDTCIIINVHY
jgi:hypothetical protein